MLNAIDRARWNYTTAAHLLNRAGFGGPPSEVQRLADFTPEQAVLYFTRYENIPDPTLKPSWAEPDPERAQRQLAMRGADPDARRQMQQQEQRTQREHLVELKHWWLQRMAYGRRQLQEKMTLFWHGHFATSMEKVKDAYLMWRQNDIFRREATGNWLRLLIDVGKDPAMLRWLDQAQSRVEHPNENFAREVMELFTLGEGHYTEKDVTEAARALTGWSFNLQTDEFINRPVFHDQGEKTVLGRTGYLRGDDVMQVIVEQPQAARFITAKLWNFFAGEYPQPDLNEALANVFRSGGNNFKPLLTAMFLSEEFYDPRIIRNQVKSPVQWLVGTVRVLQRELPGPEICFALTRNLGQDLFAPPNVKGWDGGLSWITTNNLLARYNDAAFLAQGDISVLRGINVGGGGGGAMPMPIPNRGPNQAAKPVSVTQILTEEERGDKDKLVAALEKRLLEAEFTPKQRKALHEYLDGEPKLTEDVILNTIRLMMSTPEYQLT